MTPAPALPEIVIVLDVVGSGMGPNSWPVEIGVAIAEGHAITRCESRLIRPHPEWPETAWDEESTREHGIARDALDEATASDEVAGWLLELLAGRRCWSDAAMYYRYWLNALTAPTGHGLGAVLLDDFDDALMAAFGTDPPGLAAIRAVWGHVERAPAAHRAGAGARVLAEGWLAGRRVMGEEAVG